jgi:hypothetical protein
MDKSAGGLRFWVVGLVALIASAGVSSAATINFVVQPNTGNVIFPGAGPLLGLGIGIDFVFGENTPGGAPGPFDCIDCVLNFRTGDFLGSVGNTWIFGATGPGAGIVITGGVDVNGDGNVDIGPPFEFLMAGLFVGPTISVDFLPENPLAVGLTASVFVDVKNPALAGYYGLQPFPFVGELNLTWAGIGEPPGPINAVPRVGIVINTAIPEPGTMLLLGMGFLGLLTAHRSRKR